MGDRTNCRSAKGAYQLNLDCYQALGGIELLWEIRDAFPPDMPVILDAKHGDVNISNLPGGSLPSGRWMLCLVPYYPMRDKTR
ncbi:MAG: hypothetical protein GDA56_29930 [Hormoscilla sp. GM7CHS1pb]|nr:hypothetical protein [Hormoscilla sp. GM7CHS1pb]